MTTLEEITRGAAVKGILPDRLVTIIDVRWIGTVAIEATYKDSAGRLGNELIYRDREPTLEIVCPGNLVEQWQDELNRRFHLPFEIMANETLESSRTGNWFNEASLDIVIERYRDLLKRGAVLIDDTDDGDQVRALVYLEHSIQDARTDRAGNRRVVSKRLQFVEVDQNGQPKNAGPAPYLDYRPLTSSEEREVRNELEQFLTSHFSLLSPRFNLESKAQEHAAVHIVPQHLDELRHRKEELIDKTRAAVKERLTKEINYWDHRAVQLKDQELAGKVNAKLNSGLARQRADELTARMQKRLAELEQERKLSPLPPVVLGGAMIVPVGLLKTLGGGDLADKASPPMFAQDTERSEMLAMNAVMEAERNLGNVPKDVSEQNLGYDIESSIPNTGRLRFIEVKGRIADAKTVTITKNEILTGLNKPDDFILAVCLIDGDRVAVRYVWRPFNREPDFAATSVNYDLSELLQNSMSPASGR